jgi:hypothetical protein
MQFSHESKGRGISCTLAAIHLSAANAPQRAGASLWKVAIQSIAGRYDSSVFDHQHDGSLQGARTVNRSLWNDKSLSRREFNRVVFKVDQQLSLYDIKEFVIVVVLVPVILSLHNTETNHRIIYLTEGLVVPLVLAPIGKSLLIDHLQWTH